jgi:hypothetical protein
MKRWGYERAQFLQHSNLSLTMKKEEGENGPEAS